MYDTLRVFDRMFNYTLKGEYNDKIVCAKIIFTFIDDVYFDGYSSTKKVILKSNYSQEDYQYFLKDIDEEYYTEHDNCGIDLTIWLSDGSWIENDCTGNWYHRKYPEIPENLKQF